MSNLTISAAATLTGATVATGDLIPLVDISASAGSKGSKITVGELFTGRAISGGTAAALTGLAVRSTGAAFDLTFASAEVLTAGRTLTFNVVDAARTLTLSGNPTLSGVTITGAGTIATGGFTLTVPATGTAQLTGSSLALAGFSSITGILASANGGTGVNNAGTITNASNTTITGGGTIALGGFTLTVPAAGTAALIATANVFTALQTITQGSANTGIFASTGYSVTGSNTTTAVSLAGTMNTSGVCSALNVAITTTAAAATSTLAQFLGTTTGSTNIFSVMAPTGLTSGACVKISSWFVGDYDGSGTNLYFANTNSRFSASGISLTSTGILVSKTGAFQFAGDTFTCAAPDASLMRRDPAYIGMGSPSSTPIAQTFGGAEGLTSNITGGTLNIGTRGTGTGTGGTINFQSHAAGSTGSTLGTLVIRFTIKPSGVLNVPAMPTSSSGLVSGDLYTSANVVMIVP